MQAPLPPSLIMFVGWGMTLDLLLFYFISIFSRVSIYNYYNSVEKLLYFYKHWVSYFFSSFLSAKSFHNSQCKLKTSPRPTASNDSVVTTDTGLTVIIRATLLYFLKLKINNNNNSNKYSQGCGSLSSDKRNCKDACMQMSYSLSS